MDDFYKISDKKSLLDVIKRIDELECSIMERFDNLEKMLKKKNSKSVSVSDSSGYGRWNMPTPQPLQGMVNVNDILKNSRMSR